MSLPKPLNFSFSMFVKASRDEFVRVVQELFPFVPHFLHSILVDHFHGLVCRILLGQG
jgi:hypothetical protein